jgi:DNA repair exonuclease SbcCD ATPase subunit
MSWKCHQGRPATCSLCDRQASRLEKQALLDIKAQEKRDAAQHEYDIKMMELQAKLQYQQEAMNDVQVEKDRENEIKQKEKEVEDAKQKIRDLETAKKAAAKKLVAQSTSEASASQGRSQAGGAPQAAATPRPTFPSPARDKWENQKRVDGVQNDAIDKIMDMTGLEKVKDQILRIKGNIDTMNRQGIPINKERLNLVLLGNPGTGKSPP